MLAVIFRITECQTNLLSRLTENEVPFTTVEYMSR
jgi:hypothetical protein